MRKRSNAAIRFVGLLSLALCATAMAQPVPGEPDPDTLQGGCYMEEGNWICEPPAQQSSN